MLSGNGDHPMTSTTDFSKKQLATILSALDDAPRSPANKGEALRAIGRSAARLGLTTDEVFAAAPGLLDGRLSAADFRAQLTDDEAQEPAPAPAEEGAHAGEPARQAGTAATVPHPAKAPTPRAGTKQALMIDLMKRPEGATVEQIAKTTGATASDLLPRRNRSVRRGAATSNVQVVKGTAVSVKAY